jgi:hypothetical protein
MLYSNETPLDAIVLNKPKSNMALPTKIGRSICTVEDLLSLLLRGVIVPDNFNRAGVKDGDNFTAVIDSAIVKEIRENLLPWSMQDCHITLNPGSKIGTMTDFHSRAMGLMQRHWYGKMTAADLKAEACIFVKPHEYHNEDYRALNNHAKHSAAQKIWHPHYVYGSFIYNSLLPAARKETAEWLLKFKNRGTVLANIIYALNKNKRKTNEWSLPDVNGMRTEAAKLRDVETNIKIKHLDVCDLAEALDGWFDLLKMLHLKAPGVGAIKDVTGNPFFGLYVIDHMATEKELSDSNTILAKQIIRNIGELAVMCPQLLAPKKSTVMTNVAQVFSILRKKHRRAA